METSQKFNNIGVVVIGRNEGDRLKRCLDGIIKQTQKIIYVDSVSKDDSVDFVRNVDLQIVELDMNTPFSAARARNEGFQALVSKNPEIEFIQFIDGDCELDSDWLFTASNFLSGDESCAIVAGRRSEKYPKKTIYNLLCDIEWDTPTGYTSACGGDFLCRKNAFESVGGF